MDFLGETLIQLNTVATATSSHGGFSPKPFLHVKYAI